MTDAALTDADLAALRALDTPTVCNALEIVAPERRTTGFTIKPFVCVDPALPPMVGYARTATIRAMDPPGRSADEMREQRLAYYDYVASGADPTVVVIQDLDPVRGVGAFWGEVNSAVHKGLGAIGVVTDGSIRDLNEWAEGFQALAGMLGPSHAHVHIVDFATPVNIHGMAVRSGDLIHADGHGAVVIPAAVARDVPAAADLVARKEKLVIDAARAPGFTVAALRKAMAGQADIH